MREALSCPAAHELVDERGGIARFKAVEKPAAFPHGPADRHLAQDDLEHPFAVDSHSGICIENSRERAAALETDLEPKILEYQHQAIGCALRDANRKDA